MMNFEEKHAITLLPLILSLSRKAVGIKFVKEKEKYNIDSSTELLKAMPYCVAIQSASKGHCIKMNQQTSGCPGSSRALGFTVADDMYYSGRRGFSMGLYKDTETACKVAKELCILKSRNYGIIIKPLEKWEDKPDHVLIIGEAYHIMRIIQGYTYHYGVQPDFNMSGNQGICIECTTYPFCNHILNISCLCSGTRYLAGWLDNELGAGMPFSIFPKIIDGIYKTINAVEPDEKKRNIIHKLKREGINAYTITEGNAYYLR